jgi:hypothetical protein
MIQERAGRPLPADDPITNAQSAPAVSVGDARSWPPAVAGRRLAV